MTPKLSFHLLPKSISTYFEPILTFWIPTALKPIWHQTQRDLHQKSYSSVELTSLAFGFLRRFLGNTVSRILRTTCCIALIIIACSSTADSLNNSGYAADLIINHFLPHTRPFLLMYVSFSCLTPAILWKRSKKVPKMFWVCHLHVRIPKSNPKTQTLGFRDHWHCGATHYDPESNFWKKNPSKTFVFQIVSVHVLGLPLIYWGPQAQSQSQNTCHAWPFWG